MTVSLDDTYALLAAPRRRYILVQFVAEEYRTIEGLAARIAAQEAGTAIEEASAEDRRRVEIGLLHNHLPRLSDHGVVEYDSRSGDVVRTDRFEELRPVVEEAASRIDRSAPVTAG